MDLAIGDHVIGAIGAIRQTIAMIGNGHFLMTLSNMCRTQYVLGNYA